MPVFRVTLFVAIFRQTLAGQSCKNHRSEHGFALIHHPYKSFPADRLATCYNACNTQPACQSLNYDLADRTCHFNKDTNYFRAKYFLGKANSVYADNPDSGKIFLRLSYK